MIEKTHITKEDCPETASSSRRASALFFKILAAAATLILLTQNIVVPMVHQASTVELSAAKAEITILHQVDEANGNRLTKLETLMGSIDTRLGRIEEKQDKALALAKK